MKEVKAILRADDLPPFLDLVRENATTGHIGDGAVYVTDPTRVANLRTGDEEALALL